jgi:methylenetetrahydrofolate dehydrogenase (NADP+) / methenyltetrahydrofolate cyclohydrolase
VTAQILDGTATARSVRQELQGEVAALTARGVTPGLGVVLAGDDPASAVYVRSKIRACEELGLHHETARLPSTATTEDVVARIDDYNRRGEIHGILVQLPLPPGVDVDQALARVDPAKDVDGFHPANVGLLVQNRPRFVPCTPAGIVELLRRSGISVAGRRAVVIGRSDIVGKPLALLLLHANATVTICHSRTVDLPGVTRQADLLIAAVGQPGLVTPDYVKPGAAVIDVGMNRIEDPALARELLDEERQARFANRGHALVGDVCYPGVREVAGHLTPVPGGVGPLTIAMLLRNTVRAASGAG